MTTTMNWTLLETLPSGHRLFSCLGTTRIAIADESGSTPSRTDDGVLWLDHKRNLSVHEEGLRQTGFVPLLDNNGEETRTVVDMASLMVLSAKFHWPINFRGTLFKVERA